MVPAGVTPEPLEYPQAGQSRASSRPARYRRSPSGTSRVTSLRAAVTTAMSLITMVDTLPLTLGPPSFRKGPPFCLRLDPSTSFKHQIDTEMDIQ